jgi:DNA-binding NarL/FixJ family response regulator
MATGRVVVADRHLGMLGGVHSLLDAVFDTVLMVADERSLLEAVASLNPDLAIVDLSLSGDGEANIAARLLDRYPELRIIVLSVHDEPTVAHQVQSAGAAGFVIKRSAAVDLPAAVREVLKGGTYVSPALVEQPAPKSPPQGCTSS